MYRNANAIRKFRNTISREKLDKKSGDALLIVARLAGDTARELDATASCTGECGVTVKRLAATLGVSVNTASYVSASCI